MMKRNLLLVAAILVANFSFAQFYISGSAGYATGSAEQKLGEIYTLEKTENSYGSYGNGANYQLRFGYFFNDTFGIDLGFAYLHGADQTVTKADLPSPLKLNTQADAIARARAYGFSPSIVYKFTDHLYGRFGALLKLGGKTEAVVYKEAMFNPTNGELPEGMPVGSYYQTSYVEDFHGKLPLGFVGAFGYKYDFANNFSIFAEAEYMGISVKRNDSELKSFDMGVFLPDGTKVGEYNLEHLPPGFAKKTEYFDELPANNTDPSKQLAERVPYSSFGINFGVTYNFGK